MTPTHIELLLVPFDTARRGWRMGAGPHHLAARGLASALVTRGYSVNTTAIDPEPADLPTAEIATAFGLMRTLAARVRAAVDAGAFPLVLSGNCNTAVGTLSGLSGRPRQVFWFDAHADCNTPETTTTGFLDGMALAIALGWCWRELAASIPGFDPIEPRATLLLATRDVDPLEARLLADAGIASLAPAALRDGGLESVLARVSRDAAAYLHFDLDALDPSEGQANSFPVPGGLDVATAASLAHRIAGATPLAAACLSAYAPECDRDDRVCAAAFKIVEAILPGTARRR
jgi:arginase